MTQDAIAQLDDVLSEVSLEVILDTLVDNYDASVIIGYLAEKGTFAGMVGAMGVRAAELKTSANTPMARSGWVKIRNMMEFTADRILAIENNISRYGTTQSPNRQPHPPKKKQKEMPRPRQPGDRPIAEVTPGALRDRAALAEARKGQPKRRPGRPKGSKNKKELADA